MKSRWDQSELNAMVARYTAAGINEDLAIRTYTTRILGEEPLLVLHGGGCCQLLPLRVARGLFLRQLRF